MYILHNENMLINDNAHVNKLNNITEVHVNSSNTCTKRQHLFMLETHYFCYTLNGFNILIIML